MRHARRYRYEIQHGASVGVDVRGYRNTSLVRPNIVRGITEAVPLLQPYLLLDTSRSELGPSQHQRRSCVRWCERWLRHPFGRSELLLPRRLVANLQDKVRSNETQRSANKESGCVISELHAQDCSAIRRNRSTDLVCREYPAIDNCASFWPQDSATKNNRRRNGGDPIQSVEDHENQSGCVDG